MGSGRNRLCRHRDHRAGRGEARCSRNQLLHDQEPDSRFALTVANPAQGNQILGGGAGSVVVGDGAQPTTTAWWRLCSIGFRRLSACWPTGRGRSAWTSPMARVISPAPTSRIRQIPMETTARAVSIIATSRTSSLLRKSNFHNLNRAEQAARQQLGVCSAGSHRHGPPINVTAGVDNSLTDEGKDRPNRIPGVESLFAEVKFSKSQR